jgi:hypothetical protein
MAIALDLLFQDGARQQSFAPKRNQTFGIKITRMETPQAHESFPCRRRFSFRFMGGTPDNEYTNFFFSHFGVFQTQTISPLEREYLHDYK